MLRRVVFNLPEILNLDFDLEGRLESQCEFILSEILPRFIIIFLELTNVSALIQPAVTEDDVVGAMQGILRLQRTYLISPYDVSL